MRTLKLIGSVVILMLILPVALLLRLFGWRPNGDSDIDRARSRTGAKNPESAQWNEDGNYLSLRTDRARPHSLHNSCRLHSQAKCSIRIALAFFLSLIRQRGTTLTTVLLWMPDPARITGKNEVQWFSLYAGRL